MLVIDGIDYSNLRKTELKTKIRQIFYDIIKDLNNNDKFEISKEHKYFKPLKFLAKINEEKVKDKKIKKFIVQRNPWNKITFHTSLYFKDDSYDDISFLNCIDLYCYKNLEEKKKENKRYDLFQALRKSIKEQIFEYRDKQKKENNYVCKICSELENLEVDHLQPKFRDLVWNFLTEDNENRNIKNQELINDLDYGGVKFKYLNNPLVEKWINYHKENATFRILCKKCNGKNK